MGQGEAMDNLTGEQRAFLDRHPSFKRAVEGFAAAHDRVCFALAGVEDALLAEIRNAEREEALGW